MEAVNSELGNVDVGNSNGRYKWVDVAKAIAMISVYMGHWVTPHVEAFVYGFHLQLFFIASGFFAVRSCKRSVKEWIPKQFFSIVLPYFLWVVISFWFTNLDTLDVATTDFLQIITGAKTMEPNYWFFSAFIAVVATYFILFKLIKNSKIILLLSFLLHMLVGETPIISDKYNVFANVDLWPDWLQIINNWFSMSSIPQYLFWYSLGATIFGLVVKFTEMKNNNMIVFNSVGLGTGLASMFLFFNNVTDVDVLSDFLYMNNGVLELYKICCSIIIIVFVLFISKLMENSDLLNNIGTSSMIFMGLEFITHEFFTLYFLPMINLGIPSINTTVHIFTITAIQIGINLWISNRINKYFPVLNGDYLKMRSCN